MGVAIPKLYNKRTPRRPDHSEYQANIKIWLSIVVKGNWSPTYEKISLSVHTQKSYSETIVLSSRIRASAIANAGLQC